MFVSGSQAPRVPNNQHKLKEPPHNMEKEQKANIQSYTSDYLGPNNLTRKSLDCRPRRLTCIKPKYKDMGRSDVQNEQKANMEEMTDALHRFSIATTLKEPRIQERPASLKSSDLRGVLDMTDVAKLRKAAKQEHCAVSDKVGQESCLFTHSREAGLTWSDRLCQRQLFDQQVLRTKDLTMRKCLSGSEAAKRHERRLRQALRKLPASRDPCRERLAVFSDVFDDVCDGSPVFGSVLRVIKTEYDLYIESLLSSQTPPKVKSACTPFGVSIDATEIKETASQVLLLEQEVRTALEENDRVRIECEDARARALVDQKRQENGGSETHDSSQHNEDVSPGVKQHEPSSITQVDAKRRQVWKVWNEVQRLQEDIRETMVSTVTTSALENCIRDSEEEILNFAASNVFLQKTNQDLERNISMVLSKAEVSEETKTQVWEEIQTTLNE